MIPYDSMILDCGDELIKARCWRAIAGVINFLMTFFYLITCWSIFDVIFCDGEWQVPMWLLTAIHKNVNKWMYDRVELQNKATLNAPFISTTAEEEKKPLSAH